MGTSQKTFILPGIIDCFFEVNRSIDSIIVQIKLAFPIYKKFPENSV